MSRSTPRLSNALASLAFVDYRRFAASLLLTSLGAQLVQTAVLWHVYEVTGSALLLGLTGLARAAPHIVLSMAGGVVADRVDRVRLIQAGQVANAILIALLALVTLTDAVETWHLYVATFLNSAFTAVTTPARTALIPRLVPQHNLVNAVALNATISQISQIVGPALAGAAIALGGTSSAYLVNGALYFAAMVAIIGIRAVTRAEATTTTPWRSLVEGMQFVVRRPVIISLLALDVAETALGSYRALLPIIVANLGVGAGGFGLLSAAPGVGAVVAAVFMLSLGDMRYKGLYAVGGVLAYCVALVGLALSPWFAGALIAAALLGATNTVQMIPRNAAILTMSPDALRGRVEAFRTMLAGGAPSIGYTTSGALASALGAPLALVLGAFGCAAVVIGLAAGHRELRERDLGDPVEEPLRT
ncbi:MAG: MFS transporter [Dehalococcoidia bacterium]